MMNSEFQQVISKLLETIARCRPEFFVSLGEPWPKERFLSALSGAGIDTASIPLEIPAIYELVKGTPRRLDNPSSSDFIPGYRLVLDSEYAAAYAELGSALHSADEPYPEGGAWPILASYSSDFIYLGLGKVWTFFNGDHPPVELVSSSVTTYAETLRELYEAGAYCGDEDLDSALEHAIGSQINPGIPYWAD